MPSPLRFVSLLALWLMLGAAAATNDTLIIRQTRARTNAAIAAHDLDALSAAFTDDAAFVWGNGETAKGKAGLRSGFKEDFDDPAFVLYDRSPDTLSVAASGVRASEYGHWTGLRRNADGETRSGGEYFAYWSKVGENWRIRAEIYVKLYCQGSLCKP